MSKFATLLLAVLTALPQAVGGASISGSVILDGPQGAQPAEQVVVKLFQNERDALLESGGVFTPTNTEGKFRFDALSPGTYFIRLSRTGFDRGGPFADYVLPREPVMVQIDAANGPSQEISFRLTRGSTITGRILKADGTVIDRAIVGVSPAKVAGEVAPDGSFWINGVPAGAHQRLLITPARPSKYVYTRWVDIPAGRLVAGETLEVGEVRVASMPDGMNLRGTLRDRDGELFKGITGIYLQNEEKQIRFTVMVKDGRFESAIIPGHYQVTTMSRTPTALGEVTIRADAVAELELDLGRKTDAATRPSG